MATGHPEAAELEYRHLLSVFFAAVAVAIGLFALGVLVGEGRVPAPILPPAESDKAADAKGIRESRPAALPKLPQAAPQAAEGQVQAPPANGPVEAERGTSVEPRPVSRKSRPGPKETLGEPPRVTQAAPPPPASPAALTVQGGYAIQVMAISSAEAAQSARLELRELGYPAYVVSPSGDDLYRVRVGNYVEQEDARVVRESLRTRGYAEAWIADQ